MDLIIIIVLFISMFSVIIMFSSIEILIVWFRVLSMVKVFMSENGIFVVISILMC